MFYEFVVIFCISTFDNQGNNIFLNKKREEYIFSIFSMIYKFLLDLFIKYKNDEFGGRVVLELMQFEKVLIFLCFWIFLL